MHKNYSTNQYRVSHLRYKLLIIVNKMFVSDALRLHMKYKTHTDKEIDEPLGIWLSHAPYRLQPTTKNNSKEKLI